MVKSLEELLNREIQIMVQMVTTSRSEKIKFRVTEKQAVYLRVNMKDQEGFTTEVVCYLYLLGYIIAECTLISTLTGRFLFPLSTGLISQ